MEGRILAGRFRLESQLGQGGMGSVWRAEHLSLRSAVAVKLMDPEIARTSEGAERFRREAQAAASLRSAHVVQVLDYGVDAGTPFLVMELLNGESLAAHLERVHRLSPERMVAIMSQVARAIGRAHASNIVHRDLKPDNIFLVREDDHEIVKVLDFGIAKTRDANFGSLQTRTGMTMGTPHYMSPEQAEGKRDVDHRTDLWAMAVIACECLTGARPFAGETWGELILNICARPIPVPSSQGPVPPAFDAWFATATNRDPALRFANAQDLVASLAQALGVRLDGAAAPVERRTPKPTQAMTRLPSEGPWMPAAPSAVPAAPAHALGGAPERMPMTAGPLAYDAPRAAPRARKKSNAPLFAALAFGGVSAIGAVVLFVAHLRAGSEGDAKSLPQNAAAAAASAPQPIQIAPDTADIPRGAPAPRVAPASKPSMPSEHAPRAELPNAHAELPNAHAEASALPALPPIQLPTIPSAVTLPTNHPAAQNERPAAATLRCFADPFTGAVRPAAGAKAGTATFACRQNPFTGAYQRL